MKQLLLFIIHVFVVLYVHNEGTQYYNRREKLGKTSQKVYDIGVKYLPDLSHLTWLHYLSHFMAFILPMLFGKQVFSQFVLYIVPITLIRHIFNALTILPKDPKCEYTNLTPINFIIGHCYDKIFSGHFASTVLLGFILYQQHNFPLAPIVLFNIINALMIIMLRCHYTIDIVVALLVVTVVYQNKLKL